MQQFTTIPVWDKEAKLEMTGEELMTLRQFFAIYAEPIYAVEQIFKRAVDNKQITFNFEDMEGNPIEEEVIHKWLDEFEENEKPS